MKLEERKLRSKLTKLKALHRKTAEAGKLGTRVKAVKSQVNEVAIKTSQAEVAAVAQRNAALAAQQITQQAQSEKEIALLKQKLKKAKQKNKFKTASKTDNKGA